MKKLLALLLALIMVFSMVACGAKEEAPAASEEKPAETKEETKEEPKEEAKEEAPAASEEKPVLTVALIPDPSCTDYEDNAFTHLLEEKMGVDIQIMYLPASMDDAVTKINLMASDPNAELPDVIVGGDLFLNNAKELGDAGFLADWTQYRDDADLMPNYNAMPDDVKAQIDDEMMEADGTMYDFPQYNYNFWNVSYFRWWINNDWLDAVGMEAPTTTDELKEVLIAFRDGDPNGNGIADEIPLSGQAGNDTYGNNTLYSIINSFIYFDGFIRNTGLSIDTDGKTVIAPYATEEYREALRYIKDLWDEGLISPSYFTTTYEELQAQANLETDITGIVCSGSMGLWADRYNNPNFLNKELYAPMIGPEGVRYSIQNPNVCWSFGAVVNGPNVELGMKFMDTLFDKEVAWHHDYGQAEVDWTSDPAKVAETSNVYVEIGMEKKENLAIAKINDVWAEPNNIHWWNVTPSYMPIEQITQVGDVPGANYDWNKAYNFERNDYKYEYMMPNLQYTPEEYDQLAETMALLPDYVDEMLAAFVTGGADLDKDWDSYIDTLNSMGLEDLIAVSQEALDRK